FLEDRLDRVGDGLKQPERTDPVGAVAVLEAAQQAPFDQRHVGERPEQHDRQHERLEEGDPKRIVRHEGTSARARSAAPVADVLATTLARSACTIPMGWSGRLGSVMSPGGTASVTSTMA